MAFKVWISIITAVLLTLLIVLAWDQIVHAWQLLGKLNIWILALLVPVQMAVYFAAGEMMFSYLRAKGSIKQIGPFLQARMALELNFVNHVLPSGGVSGISYMNWRLGKFGITPARATASQMVRYVTQFAAYIVLILVALAWITLDGNINRGMILISVFLVFIMTLGAIGIVFLVSSQQRSEVFARWAANFARSFLRTVTLGRFNKPVNVAPVRRFLLEMHEEYLTLRQERKLLLRPFLWGLVFNILDVSLFVITFWALGTPVSPAPILIAYGLASLSAVFVVTPGGTGAYEAIMVSFLATAGIAGGVAIAGILVTRIAVLIGAIGFGYIFYQLAILRHDK